MIDVTIQGAGIFGLAIAFACARRGAKVRVIDPGGPGAGSSGGIVGALAPHVPENWNPKKAFQLESLLLSEGFWSDVSELGGIDPGYSRSGRLQPILDDKALTLAHERSKNAKSLWKGRADWTVEEASADWCPASPTGWVIRDTLSARIQPRQSCEALAAALNAMGMEIVADGSVEGLLVLATGWRGLLNLSAEIGRPLGSGVKGQSALFAYDAADLPQIYAEALHIVPHSDGTVAIGSTSERDFDSPVATDDQCDTLIAHAREICPQLREAKVIGRWAGVRPRAVSRAPIL
ncbi:MAG: NAD(P)/FAD-dependent oxidoreductase, partial [Mangrovicoccus sp.]